MSTVNSATSPDLFAAYGPQKSAKNADDTEDRFLTLLVAQMSNQDPMNPLDNAQVTSQLAQLSTVKGIEKLNTTVETLMGRVQTSEAMAALSAVGHQVLVKGESIALYDGMAAAGFELPGDVDALTVKIYDSAGNVLHTAPLGAQKSGIHTFVWDGVTDSGATAVNNTYKFEIEATINGKKVDVTELALGRIDGVIPNQDEVTFELGGMLPVKLSDIRQFL
ncbi:MAG TPA: flagellar hook assembly protein FlgD [Burkholderiales bacterium]|nr:flagellar hook assembly protein FlgD [Burkholderiales bacterium]